MIRDLDVGDVTTAGLILGALPEAVLAVGSDDRILEVNAAALALFPALRIGAPLARILRSPDILDAIEHVRLTGEAGRASWLERVPVERVFDVNIAPIVLDAGPVLILYFREISESRRLERMRVDFVANASHELRTPLSSLLGFIETLQGPARNDPVARTRFLEIMREQAQRMARLVDDLLSLSRIEQHLHLRPQEAVDITLVLRHIVDTLGPLADDNRVDLELDLEAPVIVSGDRDELLRVAENLIENAIKYGASDGVDKRVRIGASIQDTDGVITVQDFGPGIAQEHLPRLTERFYRIDAGQSRAKGGTGLGLAIVKHIVARHRGRMTIDSKKGCGATFRVIIPLHQQ
ncbi:ATP-binding protein [Beijerinckia sp. L45]|uniref:ATP-binding protein n=1 Tax=Beijerinckia sp. L45 TaxID=1641855 RepID=UPI00131B9002|nr:ATP-binding protein [Beijerinckia sp. L45]